MTAPQETTGSGPARTRSSRTWSRHDRRHDQRPRGRSAVAWSPSRWRALGVGWREVLSLAAVAAGTLHLAVEDGGRPYAAMLPVLVLGAAATIGAWPMLRRLPRWLLIAVTWWALGPLLSLVLAEVRAGWVRPVAAWTVAGVVLIASLHLLQRRWGMRALVALAGVALATSWYRGLLVWWAGGTSRGEPAWMTLSWHNQSGTLMGVLGVAGLAVAMTRSGAVRGLGVLAAAAGLSAAWFSASRGAVVAAGIACVVVVIAAVRQRAAHGTAEQRARPVLAGLAAAVVTLAAVFVLLPVWGAASGGSSPGLAAQPVTTRAQGAASNLEARFGHWEAAVGMLATAPLTGTGPGSFRWSSVPVYPEDTNLTSSAHGEQLEALGEQGLIGGGMAVVATVGMAWLVLGVLWRPGRRWVEIMAAGVATLLLGHAALDFDWDYPLLLSLTAMVTAMLLTSRTRTSDAATDEARDTTPDAARDAATGEARDAARDDPWWAGVAVASLLVACVVAITGILVQTGQQRPPWSLQDRLEAAVTTADDDPQGARTQLAIAARWNPGAPDLPAAEGFVAHAAGELSDQELRAGIDPGTTSVPDQLRAAGRLLESGRPDLTLDIIEEARPVIDRRRAWGMTPAVAEATLLTLEAHARRDGCARAEEAAATLAPWVSGYGLEIAELHQPGQLARFDRGDHLDVWPSCAATADG